MTVGKIECSECLYNSDHPFGIAFDQHNLCTGCQVHREKNEIDWSARLNDLRKLIEPYRSKTGKHDCVIHVDGAAESFHVVGLVTRVLGLTPLLVNFNSHFLNDIGVENLARLRTQFDCDFLQYTMDLILYRRLVKEAMVKLDHVLWPYLAGKSALPARVAVRRNIPLVIWGGLPTVEQVGMFSHLDSVEMSRWQRTSHDLFGVDETSFIESSATVSMSDLESLYYPSDSELLSVGVRGIYLSNYIRWDPWRQNQETQLDGFVPESHATSFDPFEYAGCSVFMNIHDQTRFVRRGYRKVLDQCCREIRFGRISRAEAKAVLARYSEPDRDGIGRFWGFMNVTPSSEEWLNEFVLKLSDAVNASTHESSSLPRGLARVGHDRQRRASEWFLTFGKGIYT